MITVTKVIGDTTIVYHFNGVDYTATATSPRWPSPAVGTCALEKLPADVRAEFEELQGAP